MSFVSDERARLVEALRTLGPEAPTLCEGWLARDLLVHLIQREMFPHTLVARKLPGTLGASARARSSYLASAPYEELLNLFTFGRQRFSPLNVPSIDSGMNTLEYSIHLEDLLRTDSPASLPTRRTLEPRDQASIFAKIKPFSQALLARSPVRVELDSPGHGRYTIAATRKRPGRVTILGEPLELALFAYGRESVANVHLLGDAHAVDALRGARRRV